MQEEAPLSWERGEINGIGKPFCVAVSVKILRCCN